MTPHASLLKTDETSATVISLWPVRAIALLLVIEAFALVGISAYFAAQLDWERELETFMPSDAMIDILLWLLGAAPLALLFLFTAVGFFFRWRMAWLIAMSGQGFLLLGCLTFYFFTQSDLRRAGSIHLLMAYAILMVLYQNTMDVRIAFHPIEGEEGQHPLEGDEARFRKSEFGDSLVDSPVVDPPIIDPTVIGKDFTLPISKSEADERAADEFTR